MADACISSPLVDRIRSSLVGSAIRSNEPPSGFIDDWAFDPPSRLIRANGGCAADNERR